MTSEIIKFGTISEDENGDIVLSNFNFEYDDDSFHSETNDVITLTIIIDHLQGVLNEIKPAAKVDVSEVTKGKEAFMLYSDEDYQTLHKVDKS